MKQFKNPSPYYRIHFMRHDYISKTPAMEHPVYTQGAPSMEEYLEMGAGGIVTNDAWNEQYLQNPASIKALDNLVTKSVELGADIWLYDENGYPSGTASGHVLVDHPEFEAAGITLLKETGEGAAPISWNLPDDLETIVSAYFLTETGEALPINYSSRQLNAQSPDGAWTLFVVAMSRMYANTIASHSGNNDRHMSNLFSKAAVDRFIACTYDYYKDNISHFSDVTAIFTDEPTSCEAVLTDSIPYVKIAWCDEVEARFEAMFGYDLRTKYHCLFEGDLADDMAVRTNYRQLLGTLFAENYVGNIADWCEANGTLFSGHFNMEENIHSHVANYGNLMMALKRQGAPGGDCLTCSLENYLNENTGYWGVSNWFMGPKYVGSAARVTGKKLSMVEYCPVDMQPAGQFRTMEDCYAITNLVFFSGINHINSYMQSWNIGEKLPDKHCGDQMRPYSDYAARLALFLRQATHDSRIGVYYPIETVQAYFKGMNTTLDDITLGKKATLIQQTLMRLTKLLWAAQTDHTFIDAQSIEEAVIEGDILRIGDLSLRSLIMPHTEVISPAVLTKLQAWEKAGGVVSWVGETPSVSTVPQGHDALQKAASSLAPVSVEEAVSLAKAAADDKLTVDLIGDTLYSCRYQLDGETWYFLVNMSAEEQTVTFSVDGAKGYNVYDSVTGDTTPLEENNGTTVLRGYRSAFVEVKFG